MIKDSVKNLEVSSTLRINEISKELETKGKNIFRFGFGQSPFEIPEDVVDELKNNAFRNKYLPIQGLPELREVIAKYISYKKNYNYKAENILIGPGTKELMFLLQIIFDGEVILPSPSWVSYEPQAILGRNKVHWVETHRENNWFPTSRDIEKIISSNQKKNYLLFLNSPNNPSGQICKNLDEISKIVKKYNILVLSDEIYSELSFEDNYKSISNYCPQNTIISAGLSKWCGAGGWRLGHFVIPNELTKLKNSLKVLASETFSSVSAPIQYAAITAYENDHTDYINKSRKILKLVGEYVYNNLKSNKMLINKPQGGFYLMPEFLDIKFKNSQELCSSLLNDTGVVLLPGSDFGFSKDKLITRLSFTDFNGKEFMKNLPEKNQMDNNLVHKFAPKIVEGTKRLKAWVESI
ncbi:MAG: aspartate aminotransferase [Candidatus Pelagibacter sp.]|nr:aspartate aminotransferase [Candidatus Pelagibacter sp.]|tara:strand:- start:491 stop:1717 length:1227 start_codon:yes stop_codon:yes gene_type:complete